MNEKAIVFYCKDCGALFFAVMQNIAYEYRAEIAGYLADGDRMEVVDASVVNVQFQRCTCYDRIKKPSITDLPLFSDETIKYCDALRDAVAKARGETNG